MVFPSLPIYLDPPNWQQASNQQQEGNDEGGGGYQLYHNNNNNNQGQGGGGSIIRAGSSISMGETQRARLGKIQQQPGPADAGAVLKCPRCESTNTKFCYYNNYNLSQPRHFCKTCRRYWTRGGALRNVPVGGGCRRNKRSSSTSTNKLPSSSSKSHPLKLPAAGGSSSASANSSSSNGCSTTINNNSDVNNNVLVGGGHLPTTHQFPFLTSSLNQYHHYNNNGDFGSRFGGTNPTSSLVAKNINGNGSAHEFQIGTAGSSSNGGSLCLGTEQWRLHNLQQVHHHHQQQNQQVLQFPFLTNLEPQIGSLFQFGSSGGNNNSNNAEAPRFNFGSKAVDSTSVSTGILMPQLNTMIKMETNNGQGQGQGLSNLPKNLLSGSGSSNNSDLFWNGSGNNIVNAWSEVPSFTPSPSHLL